jgi:hypothetical protein
MNTVLINRHLGFEPAKLVASLQAQGLVSFAKPERQTQVGRPPKTEPISLYDACVQKTGYDRMAGRPMTQRIHLMGFNQEERQTIERIIAAVCAEWSVTQGQLVTQDRFQCLIWPRFMALYLLSLAGFEDEAAARVLRRHRTLMVNVKHRVREELVANPGALVALNRLTAQLNLSLEETVS